MGNVVSSILQGFDRGFVALVGEHIMLEVLMPPRLQDQRSKVGSNRLLVYRD